jgi:CheY-like chemotaxis protein
MRDTRRLTILQVEDTPSDVSLTADALVMSNVPHAVHVATDGAEAIEFLKRAGRYRDAPRPDLILLDLDLPRLNGAQVLDFVKRDEDFKTIPVIIFSTLDSEESKNNAYRLHANSYVVKPMDLEAFAEKVQSIAEYWCHTSAL